MHLIPILTKSIKIILPNTHRKEFKYTFLYSVALHVTKVMVCKRFIKVQQNNVFVKRKYALSRARFYLYYGKIDPNREIELRVKLLLT